MPNSALEPTAVRVRWQKRFEDKLGESNTKANGVGRSAQPYLRDVAGSKWITTR